MAQLARLTVPAWAKLNLALAVGTRQADGYHELETVFHSLEWHDDVSIEWHPDSPDGLSLGVDGDPSVPAGEGNLVWKAARLLMDGLGLAGSVHIQLAKRIPSGGGLGGGSADAAAVLSALNALAPAPVTEPELLAMAARLGSDVPFALRGGTCRGWGRGQHLAPVPLWRALHFVVVIPPFQVSTPWAYGQWAARARPLESGVVLRVVEALLAGETPPLYNDLESVVPEAAPIKAALLAAGAEAALMTGSGSCCFGLARDAAHARSIAAEVQVPGARVLVTRSRDGM